MYGMVGVPILENWSGRAYVMVWSLPDMADVLSYHE
jgi:hypothetical protein